MELGIHYMILYVVISYPKIIYSANVAHPLSSVPKGYPELGGSRGCLILMGKELIFRA